VAGFQGFWSTWAPVAVKDTADSENQVEFVGPAEEHISFPPPWQITNLSSDFGIE
jgi:hypothetical protein